MKNTRIALFSFVAIVLAAASLYAQPQNDFAISVGWFPTNFSSSARLSPSQGQGTTVDLEDLGFNTNVQNVRLEGFWRFKPRHRVEFAYTSWRRSAETTVDRSFQWGDGLFGVGAHVKGANNAQFIKLAYAYSLMRTDSTDIALSAGFDTLWNKTTIEGNATMSGPNGGTVSADYKGRKDYIAPAPVFGVNANYLATPKTLLRGTAEYFQVNNVQDTDFKILDLRGSVDYLFSPSYSVGVGYTYVAYKVGRPRFGGEYDFSGPLLYFAYRR